MNAVTTIPQRPTVDRFGKPRPQFMVVSVDPATGQGELLITNVSERVAISFACGFNSEPADDASDLRAYVVPQEPSEAEPTAKAADRSNYWETVVRRPGMPDKVLYSGVSRWAAKCYRKGFNHAAKKQGTQDRAYVRPCQPAIAAVRG